MYDTKFVCTYNTSEVFSEEDNQIITDEEKEFIRDAIYRQELLNILEINEYNEPEINKAIHELYGRVKDCETLRDCMLKLASHFMSTDDEFGLMIMFCYDYMYLSHICISEFIETGKIDEKNMKNLKNIVF
jgi:hypothetical protein